MRPSRICTFVRPAPGAAATTFCVPNFHAACPNNGTNVAEAGHVFLAAGVVTEGTGTFEPPSGSKNRSPR